MRDANTWRARKKYVKNFFKVVTTLGLFIIIWYDAKSAENLWWKRSEEGLEILLSFWGGQVGMVSIDAGPIDAGFIDADSLMPTQLMPMLFWCQARLMPKKLFWCQTRLMPGSIDAQEALLMPSKLFWCRSLLMPVTIDAGHYWCRSKPQTRILLGSIAQLG